MKKLFAYGAVLAVLTVPVVSLAAEFRAGDQPSVRADEQVINDIYITGGSVTSAGSITGDLVAAGGTVVVSGEVGADAIVGGGNVSIVSNVGDDVRIVGGTIVISGRIGGDVIAAGGQITVSGPGISGDVVAGGGTIRIDAPVAGEVDISGGSVYINAPISGNVEIDAGKVELGSGAVISGNLTYKADKEMIKADGAVVNGTTTFEPRSGKMKSGATFAAIFSALLIWKFFALLACSMLIGLLLRRFSKEVVMFAQARPLKELGRGILVMAATPLICVLLFATVVGIPLGILALIGFFAMLLSAWFIAPIILGSITYSYFTKKELEVSWQTILLGVVLYAVLWLVPFVGWLAQIILMFISIGSVFAMKWRIVKEWR